MGALRDEVAEKVDLLNFLQEHAHLPLKRSGGTWACSCPFHTEKKGSFTVYPEQGHWYCFGCGTGGSVFDFVMKAEHLSFKEALVALARQYHVEIPEERARPEGLYRILKRAMGDYAEQLNATVGALARRYLEGRGVTLEQANSLGLGFAREPLWKRVSPEEREEGVAAGVFGENQGRYWDFFHGRLIFPITSIDGEIIALSGRILGEGEPKYLTPPETPIFSKGRAFYGLEPPAVRAKDLAVVVEGQFDVLGLKLAQVSNAAGTLGCGFTEHHAKKLGYFARNFLFFRDGDRAGRRALFRDVENTIRAGRNPFVAELPEGEDPFSLLAKGGVEALRALRREDGFEYFLKKSCDAGPVGRDRHLAEVVLPLLKAYPSPLLQDLRIEQAARVFGVQQDSIRKALGVSDVDARVAEMEEAFLRVLENSMEARRALWGWGRLDRLFRGSNLEKVRELLG